MFSSRARITVVCVLGGGREGEEDGWCELRQRERERAIERVIDTEG